MPTLEHPYAGFHDAPWLRGNLHTHTTQSDGEQPIQQVLDAYAAAGYQFLMISDHDLLTDDRTYRTLNDHGMILLPGNEITARGPHLLHVNARERIEPAAQRQVAIRQAVESGGFVIANHPNWERHFDHCPIAALREWVGITGIEIFNAVAQRLDGSAYGANKWDMLLAQGRRVWGFANDDSHAPIDIAQGWSVAQVRERSAAGVAEALRAGRFYASTGVTINDIWVAGNRLGIATENAQRIAAFMQVGKRFAAVDGDGLEITVPADATYVRLECYGAGGRCAWTQPFFVVG